MVQATGAGDAGARRLVFDAVVLACALFVALTFAAMLAYPGGTYADPATAGFSFWNNFFSDLGRTRTRLGGGQVLSRLLFTTALLLVAAGLAAFFAAFAGLVRSARPARGLALAGSACGCLAAVAFAGVALVPADVALALHDRLVQWAFRAFLAAVLCYLPALAREPALPRSLLRVFAAFAALLAGYVALITWGPSPHEAAGQTVQATGQKVIVYAAVLAVAAQARIARQVGPPRATRP
jgi:hypothetical protein